MFKRNFFSALATIAAIGMPFMGVASAQTVGTIDIYNGDSTPINYWDRGCYRYVPVLADDISTSYNRQWINAERGIHLRPDKNECYSFR